eukprot:5771271-Pyramimonas_sp.AAC.1
MPPHAPEKITFAISASSACTASCSSSARQFCASSQSQQSQIGPLQYSQIIANHSNNRKL